MRDFLTTNTKIPQMTLTLSRNHFAFSMTWLSWDFIFFFITPQPQLPDSIDSCSCVEGPGKDWEAVWVVGVGTEGPLPASPLLSKSLTPLWGLPFLSQEMRRWQRMGHFGKGKHFYRSASTYLRHTAEYSQTAHSSVIHTKIKKQHLWTPEAPPGNYRPSNRNHSLDF